MTDPGTAGAQDAPSLLRELHHRVKNNFQIIASLINLKKRAAPPTHQEDLRFLEEHVMVMAAAHRLVFASGAMMEVNLTDLIIEVSEGLRVIAGLPARQLSVQAHNIEAGVPLDQAIGIGLYLAVALPPHLDRAVEAGSRVILRIVPDPLHLKIIPQAPGRAELDGLRRRLMGAYVRQLATASVHDHEDGGSALHLGSLGAPSTE